MDGAEFQKIWHSSVSPCKSSGNICFYASIQANISHPLFYDTKVVEILQNECAMDFLLSFHVPLPLASMKETQLPFPTQ